ncbi:MAG: hypothetical protein WB424_19030 [Terracidiphilus sp.]|jgi:hypothetical protein
MNNRLAVECWSAGVAILALSALAFGAAQQNPQGQYHLSYSPLALDSTLSTESLATYAPIKSIDGKTIQLRSQDGITYIFTLTAETIYCNGESKVSDWGYLKNVPKKASITVLSPDVLNPTALIVWDKEPSISTANGQIDFALPPLCK